MKTCVLFLALFFIGTSVTMANNVQITNVSIINNGPGAISVKFDLSWSNSWRTNVGPANYDGVWVFFKYKNTGGKWMHANLTGNNNILPNGFSVFQNNGINKTGAMIYRDSANLGAGNVSATNIQLGVSNTLPYDIDIRAFALEMVYVPAPPTGRSIFGDGDGVNESLYALHYSDNTATTNSTLPMYCDAGSGLDDAELTSDGIYVYSNDTIQKTNPLGGLDPFPSMKALWCMKYEISQAGYRDFLNTLDSQQQVTRTLAPVTSSTGTSAMGSASFGYRNYIKIATPAALNTPAVFGCDANANNIFDQTTDGEWVACNYLYWPDVAAYLDWSGLAPMSELQYERMCRGNTSAGPNVAILGEYAWGNTSIFSSSYSLSNSGAANELASNASTTLGNAVYSATASSIPLRTGIFATATSNRTTSGASFYGIMDMSGSVYEYTIHLGSVAGRSCRYVPNGDGTLSDLGYAKLSVGGAGFWPGMEANISSSTANTCVGTCEVTGAAGIRLRGGSSSTGAPSLSISDRSTTFIPTARATDRGGRGVLYIR